MATPVRSTTKTSEAKRGLLAVCVLAAVAAVASLGSAPAWAEVTASDKETARTAYNDGNKLLDQGDVKGALEKFKVAHGLARTPITGLALGKAYRQLKQYVEAREAFLDVLRIPAEPKENPKYPAARQEAGKLAEDVKQQLAYVKLVVQGVPPGSSPTVTLDEQIVPTISLGELRTVNPGMHVAVARVGTGPETRVEATLAEGETRELAIVVTVPPPPPVETPVEAPPPPPAETPPQPRPPSPPPAEAAPAPVQTQPPMQAPASTTSGRTSALVPLGFAAFGVGGVIGTVCGVVVLGNASSLKASCPSGICTSDADTDKLRSTQTLGTVSNIAFAASAGGLLLGIIGLATSPRDEPQPATSAVQVKPWIGLGFAGLTGSF